MMTTRARPRRTPLRQCLPCAMDRHIRCEGKGGDGRACGCRDADCMGHGLPAYGSHGHREHTCSPDCWGWVKR